MTPAKMHQAMEKSCIDLCQFLEKKDKVKFQNTNATKDFIDFLKTDLYLSYALDSYYFLCELHNGNPLARMKFAFFMTSEDITNILNSISYSAGEIKINSETADLFQEAVAWLNGLYQHSLASIPPYLKNGVAISNQGYAYIGDKENDLLFRYQFPLTKIKIAEYNKAHALVLNERLQLNEGKSLQLKQ